MKACLQCSILILILFLSKSHVAYCQDSTQLSTQYFTLSLDSILLNSSFSIHSFFNYLEHSSSKEDKRFYKHHKQLLHQSPTRKNYEEYHQLACALWDLEKTEDAEKLFLSIFHSTAEYYESPYYSNSDVAGDTIANSSGYGSYTFHYKNSAAIHLCKIYLEQKKFDIAYQFMQQATQKYATNYTCGTGFWRQQNEYDFLLASCYNGLNRWQESIDLLLPYCLERNDELIIKAIQNIYSPTQIRAYLQEAENSITFAADSIPSYSYTTTYESGSNQEKTDTLTYYSGQATINLFGKIIMMPIPFLKDEERMTKEHFVKELRRSYFYTELISASPE